MTMLMMRMSDSFFDGRRGGGVSGLGVSEVFIESGVSLIQCTVRYFVALAQRPNQRQNDIFLSQP